MSSTQAERQTSKAGADGTEKKNEQMEVEDEPLDEEILRMSADDLKSRTHLVENEIRIMRSEIQRISHAIDTLTSHVKENTERIKVNKTLPYLVSNVVELLLLEELQEDEGANVDLDAHKTKCAVIKTSTRATYFLPVVGLVDPSELKPGDLVGVNKDSYLVLEKLPAEYDSRVKAMEVDERPNEQYSDIGGCDKQIQELIEAVVLPMTHKDRFLNLGIHPPKGVLLYGPPGTGKTMMARAVAAQTKSTFLKLAGPQLVQMFIGDGAKLVRDAFALAKEKAPAIIFIDELDAIGTKRFDSEKAGDREVQRTMLELLNQLDGFQMNDDIKVIAATNRVDVLDPALLRSGRLDRKIELPNPTEDARARIMQIHSRKMNVHKDVNFEELARCTDDFNGAQCKAVCVEAVGYKKELQICLKAICDLTGDSFSSYNLRCWKDLSKMQKGMIALRRDAVEVMHEDFMDAILELEVIEWRHLDKYSLSTYIFTSSCSIRFLIYPFNFIKSRLQLQKQNTVYTGVRHALMHIIRNEGLRGLYRGFLMTVPQNVAPLIYCNAYEKTRESLKFHLGLSSDKLVSSLAGGAVSLLTQVIFVPTDITSQYMIIYNNPSAFAGEAHHAAVLNYIQQNKTKLPSRPAFQILRALYHVDGYRGFFRGYVASAGLGMSAGSIFWTVYYTCLESIRWCRRKFLHKLLGYEKEGHPYLLLDQGIAAASSSVVATTLTNPLEILRLRIQVQRASYAGTIRTMWFDERYRIITKGLLPRIINSCVYATATMMVYETLKKVCVLPEYEGQVIW
uniref:AAA+ ATPase domain-containing protein n=1 Tax=Setaria digitata TaxID=48799 RepID=A0A915PJK6_9BILA